jgi:hypothetical protein
MQWNPDLYIYFGSIFNFCSPSTTHILYRARRLPFPRARLFSSGPPTKTPKRRFTETIQHDVLGTVTVSILRWQEGDSYSVGSLRKRLPHAYFCVALQDRYHFLLWSIGQSFWLQIQSSRSRFHALPDFLRSSGPGKASTQVHKNYWGDNWMKFSGSALEKRD